MAKKKKSSEKPCSNKHAGLVFAGCMFLGMGIGSLYDSTGTGTMLGMGVGFFLMYYVKSNN